MRYPAARPAEEFGFENILYSKQAGVATVTLNRPQVHNALNFLTLREMARAFEDAAWDDAVAVVVLTGAGEKAFCTGADLDEQELFLRQPRDYWKWMGAFIEAHDRLRHIGKPTVARLNGMVVGGGNEFNMACDLAVAADDVFIRQVGTARGSVPAGGATQWLPLLVGDRRAREILWLCDEIPAQQALEWGLINRVAPRAQLDAVVADMTTRLINKLPECMHHTKTQINFWRDFSWSSTVQYARDWLSQHAGSPEVYEGLSSFKEKRPPDYAGIRAALATGKSTEFLWGPHTRQCPECGTKALPEGHSFCGRCGARLED